MAYVWFSSFEIWTHTHVLPYPYDLVYQLMRPDVDRSQNHVHLFLENSLLCDSLPVKNQDM